MKTLVAFCILLLLSGCVTATRQKNSQEKIANEFAGDMIIAKTTENGEKVLCDQQGYLNCFQTSKEQCYSDLAPKKEQCVEESKRFFDPSNGKESFNKYLTNFMLCMTTYHGIKYSLQNANLSTNVGSCMEKLQLDEEMALRSLFGIPKS